MKTTSEILRSPRVRIGGGTLLFIFAACMLSLPWTMNTNGVMFYDHQDKTRSELPPSISPAWMALGSDKVGHGLLARCLIGGAISLTVGIAAACVSVGLGVSVGLLAGYRGGWVDGLLMRSVDILYGLPYILLVILLKIALEDPMRDHLFRGVAAAANLVVIFVAIGLVSWLEMARVIRGQVLSLRTMPYIEAAYAAGANERRIFLRHLLPNLVSPIMVYATLIIPQAILQESFLSFLGAGGQAPLPSWGSLAAAGLLPGLNPIHWRWWLLVFPCTLLGLTLLSLNFLGDGLRDLFDPKRETTRM
jgi:ABC-type dipeptide/oligopeptide/nickel transport system permease subunit